MSEPSLHESFSLYGSAIPVSVRNYQRAPHAPVFKAHWHEKIEILAVVSGSLQVVCDDTVVTARAGDIVFINPYEVHTGHSLEDGVNYYCVITEPGFWNIPESAGGGDMLGLHRSYIKIANHIEDPEMFDTVSRVAEEAQNRAEYYEMFVRSLLFLFISRAFRHHRAVKRQPTESENTAADILAYINHHYAEKLSSQQLADHFGFSLSYFCRYFKRITGETILEYITAVRLSKACELLRQTSLPITEIADRVGFSGLNYFIRQFRLKMDVTPLQFRKHHRH